MAYWQLGGGAGNGIACAAVCVSVTSPQALPMQWLTASMERGMR